MESLDVSRMVRDFAKFKELVIHNYVKICKMEFKIQKLYEVMNKIEIFLSETEEKKNESLHLLSKCHSEITSLSEKLVNTRESFQLLLKVNATILPELTCLVCLENNVTPVTSCGCSLCWICYSMIPTRICQDCRHEYHTAYMT